MVKVKILGISGTFIKDGNCDAMVKAALEAAESVSDVDTDFVTLADKNIAVCQHCQWCIENRSPCKIKDDFHEVAQKMLGADGFVLAGPTWRSTLAPALMHLLSRTRYFDFFTGELRNKPVASLTLGWFGLGMDNAISVIEDMIYTSGMIPVARASAIVSTAAKGERAAYTEHGVLDDALGMREVHTAAYRLVEVARMIKFAKDAGVSVPPDKLVLFTGSRFKREKEKVFIDGVWRDKEPSA